MNNTKNIYETLSSLRISRSQTGLYLEFIKSGSSTVAQASRALNTSRQAIYLLLPALIDRGLIKEVKQGKRTLYQALPPSQLFILVDDLKARLDEVVPTLTNLLTVPSEVPLVTIYDTPLAMREWYRHFMDKVQDGDEFLLYDSGDITNWFKLDPDFYRSYMEKQLEKHVKLLCLLPKNKEAADFINEAGWSISEHRYTSRPMSEKVEQWIWRDEVCYQTIQGNATNLIVLKSAALADFSREQFMEIWVRAEN
jgi:predicted transcriptional regulator